MKRFIVFFVIFVVFGNSAFAEFVDVDWKSPNFVAINDLEAKGVVNGRGEGIFAPYESINRAEFLKIVLEGKGVDVSDVDGQVIGKFPDVEYGEWYGPYVYKGLELGLIDGDEDGNFYPDREVNFVEAAKITTNTFDLKKVEATPVWYENYVRALLNDGAVPETIYSFDQNLTRAEMAEMIWRVMSDGGENLLSYEDLENERISVPLERALPLESDIVVEIDGREKGQIDGLRSFLSTTFPDFEKFENGMIEEYENGVLGLAETFSYENLLEPLLAGDWNIVYGMKYPDWILQRDHFYDLDAEKGQLEIYFIGKFEHYNLMRELIHGVLYRGDEIGYDHQNLGEVEYWSSSYESMYFLRIGDVFILSNTREFLDEALERLLRGNGFDFQKMNYANLKKGSSLVSVFVKEKFANWIYDEFLGALGGEDSFDYLADVYLELEVLDGVPLVKEYSYLDFAGVSEVVVEENGIRYERNVEGAVL